MKNRLFLWLVVLLVFGTESAWADSAAAEHLGLVPAPRSVEFAEGAFHYGPGVAVVADGEVADYVHQYLAGGPFGLGGVVEIVRNQSLELPAEGYTLTVRPGAIKIEGVDRAGMLNGFHTLLQLFPKEVYGGGFESECEIPALRIVDWPEYPYRGMHFDIARTFSTREQVEEMISHLAHHKINHLHFHLTDDEGWRVEILSHPELTEIAAWRGGDSPIWPVYGAWEEKYGGYLTQEELRYIVAYAHQRGVTVVPEIDLPGHSLAIGKVHPEILCPVEIDTSKSAGYSKQNVWCVAREENYVLLEDILREICDIFPSEYIHIGGDEVDMSHWRKCPHCRELMRQKGYTSTSQLQEHFMNRLKEILAKYGRKPAMWNEATNSGTLSRQVRIHGWEGLEECRKVAEAGYPTVVMPGPYFYFDMRQSKDEDGHNWAGVVTLEKCYSVDLDALGYSARAKRNVIGFSGAFWTELYLTHRHKYENYAEYQIFPRASALAEICWLPQAERNWQSFESRLERHKERLEAMGISYRRGAPAEPEGTVIKPAMRCTTSLPFRSEKSPAQLAAYSNDYGHRTSRTCKEGEWILYEFAEPLVGVVVELTTGYRHVARGLFPVGVVEISADGKTFSEVAPLKGGCATLTISEPIRAIRLRCTRTGNGDSFVYIQHPIIRRVES